MRVLVGAVSMARWAMCRCRRTRSRSARARRSPGRPTQAATPTTTPDPDTPPSRSGRRRRTATRPIPAASAARPRRRAVPGFSTHKLNDSAQWVGGADDGMSITAIQEGGPRRLLSLDGRLAVVRLGPFTHAVLGFGPLSHSGITCQVVGRHRSEERGLAQSRREPVQGPFGSVAMQVTLRS